MSSAHPQEYAEAFLRAKHEKKLSDEALIERLIAVASQNNDRRKLPSIAKRVEEDMTRDNGGDVIQVTSARELPKKLREEFLSSFDPKKDTVRFEVDPTLHAGVRISKNGEEDLDASFARKLSKLFS